MTAVNNHFGKSDAILHPQRAVGEAHVKTLEEYKAGLMKQKDKFARAFSVKMLTYALGRPIDYTDRKVVDALTDALKKKNYRIQSLVYAIVASEPFTTIA